VSAGPRLTGKRIVVTRPRHQARPLTEALRRLGAEVVEAPAIRIEPPNDYAPLDRALRALTTYDWIVFTSANGVEAFFERRSSVDPAGDATALRFAAIGPATNDCLVERGLRAEVIPDRFIAEDVFRALSEAEDLAGKRILLPRADIARQTLPDLMREAGAVVDVVVAYRTVPAKEEIRAAAALVREDAIDVVTFTSASTAKSFFDAISPASLSPRVAAASIGPVTSRALRDLGVEPAIEAERYTVDGLVEAILRHCGEN
jgi:uroporphyrinogen III methyltransferase / synthase